MRSFPRVLDPARKGEVLTTLKIVNKGSSPGKQKF
jgi:hypothetical protein